MSFVAIRPKIKAILDARQVAGVLGQVFDGEQDQQKVDVAAYPVAELRRANSVGDYLTNVEDVPSYNFEVWLYAEADNDDVSTAEKSLDAVLDDLIYQFAKDRDLTGTADGGVRPSVSNTGFMEWRGKRHYVAVLQLECRKVLSRL